MDMIKAPVKAIDNFEKHFVKLPLATVLAGKTNYVDLIVEFWHDPLTEHFRMGDIKGVANSKVYDCNYIYQTHGEIIARLIAGNKENWNVEETWYRPINGKRLKLIS